MPMIGLRRLLVLLFSGAPDGVPAAELITGIMHPAGATGSQTPPGVDWTLRFTLEEWRGADGTIHTTPLSVTRTTTHGETQALMDRLNSRRVISVRVRFTGENTAELLDVVDTRLAADDPLLLRAELLSRPVTHEDERFGTLVLDRSAGWWEGKAAWGADTIVVQMEAENEVELRPHCERLGRCGTIRWRGPRGSGRSRYSRSCLGRTRAGSMKVRRK
jgi:hypothetical protein